MRKIFIYKQKGLQNSPHISQRQNCTMQARLMINVCRRSKGEILGENSANGKAGKALLNEKTNYIISLRNIPSLKKEMEN